MTLCGVAALMATPSLVATQPGGGYDDIVGLALLLACAAILINNHAARGRSRLVGVVIASLAAGLALGTKWTFIVPIGALTLGVFVVAGRGRRLRDTSFWLAGVALTGSFWYVRNWVAVGNPVPSAHVKVGPFSLPNPEITTPLPLSPTSLHDGSIGENTSCLVYGWLSARPGGRCSVSPSLG